MGKLKYTSNGVVIQNELTITGSDGTSVNVKEKLDEAGSSIIYEGEFYANDCLTPGIYQYIVTGRTGLDTVNDDHYSLLVMKTDANTIRQIAFGSKQHSNIYSRVCVNGNWDDAASNVNFQKVGNINTINLAMDADIAAKHKLIDALGLSEFYITDANGMYPGEGTITVTSANMKLLQDTLASSSDAISAFLSNWQAYYKILTTWYSQTVSDYVASKTGTFKVGDKLKLYKRTTSIAEYFKQIIDWKNIDIQSKMSEAEKAVWQAMMANYGVSTDGECILAMINAGDIYSAYTEPNEGGTTYQLKGSDAITIYDYIVIEAEDNLHNACSASVNTYKQAKFGNDWKTLIGNSTIDAATSLMEVYAGWGSVEQSEFHLCLPLVYCSPNTILKLRCFYRKGAEATDYKYDSDAYMYVSNTTDLIPRGHDGIGYGVLMSDYVPVRSLGSFELLKDSYPNDLSAVRANFFKSDWDYGYQYLKLNNPSVDTLYLHISGTFDTIKSWFCLDYADIQCYVPYDKVGDLTNLTTTAKTDTVGAINELDSNIGDLSDLTTAAKTNVVSAINELNAKTPEGTDPIIIKFPADKMGTEVDDVTIGLRGETIHMIPVLNDESNIFYTTLGAELTDTNETYFEKLKNHIVLMDGAADNYLKPATIQNEGDQIWITWHAHFFVERDDEQYVDFNIGDCVCMIDFDTKSAEFIMTQWTDDEMHLVNPILINLDWVITDMGSENETLTITLQKRENNSWANVTATEVIGYLKKGYNVQFGIWDKNGSNPAYDPDKESDEYVFKRGQYDVYYDTTLMNKQWLMLRWANFDSKKCDEEGASSTGYYFTNTFTVIAFDESGVCKVITKPNVQVQGGEYVYKIIQDVAGDAYINAYLQKDNTNKYVLHTTANTRKLSAAKESNDGLATAYDVKTYVDKIDTKADDILSILKSMTYVAVTFDGAALHMNNKYNFGEQGYAAVYDNAGVSVLAQVPVEAGVYRTKLGELLLQDDTYDKFNTVELTSLSADMDIASSVVLSTEENYKPLVVFPDDADFEFFVTVDGDIKWRMDDEGGEFPKTHIDDDIIEFLKANIPTVSDEFIAHVSEYKDKGWSCSMGHKAYLDYGFTYNGNDYYWIDNEKQYSSGELLFGYETLDKSDCIWTTQDIYSSAIKDSSEYGKYIPGDVITVMTYTYDGDPTVPPVEKENITVTVKLRYR